tara:strand:- start:679 stop:1014 length:336 start_codon:yes stop_codon:yes gene_type:complete
MAIGGAIAGGIAGGIGGGALGSAIGGEPGRIIGGAIGGTLGRIGGVFMPFKTGGKVPGAKGKAVKAIVHGGEFVLPAQVKPTKAQLAAVAKIKRATKKKPTVKARKGKKNK